MRLDIKQAQKISYAVNSAMLVMTIGFAVLYILLDAGFLIMFSIPTALLYLALYITIYKQKLDVFLWTIYAWLTLYTSVTAVCLGTGYGFHLYCFSMIPCVYTTEYMSFKLGKKSVRSFYISIGITVYYLIFMGYLSHSGPVYDRNGRFSVFFLMFNSITVFSYLVIYTNYLIRSIISSEKKLTEMAHTDRLTGLYNRHYMLTRLSELLEDGSQMTLAIADIDDFKKINDTCGHNAGDEVLKVISKKMKAVCKGCEIARWGGEEFLILLYCGEDDARETLEKIRGDIDAEPVVFDKKRIAVTITVGMSRKQEGQSIDEWIQHIDDLLYAGKNSGKNKVVQEKDK